EVRIAATPAATPRDHTALALGSEVGPRSTAFGRVRVVNQCAERNVHFHGRPIASLTSAPLAVGTALGPQLGPQPQVEERGQVAIRDQQDVAAAATVAAVRTSPGYVLFTAKAHATV